MKRKWCVLALVTLLLALHASGKAEPSPDAKAPAATPWPLWKPKLVGTNPDGSAWLTWASDGQSVQVAPKDTRQNLQWGVRSLPASAGSSLPRKTQIASALFEIRPSAYFSSDGSKCSINLYSFKTKKAFALQNTPWERFGLDMEYPEHWRFQALAFAHDWSKVFIASAGTIFCWSTATGKLLQRARFKESQDGPSFLTAISRDGRFVVAQNNRLWGDSQPGGLFDARTGRNLFEFSQNTDLGVGFSPGGTVFWSSSRIERVPDDGGQELAFFDTRTRRCLWSALSFSRTQIKFFAPQQTVIFVGKAGLQFHDVRTGRLQLNLQIPPQDVEDFAVSPDGSQLWASYANGQIWSWRLR